jgi:integrase
MAIPTTEQVSAILRVAKPEWRAFFAVAAFAGARLGEVAGLQVADVHFLAREIELQRQVQRLNGGELDIRPPKYQSERTVPAPDALLTMLAEHVRLFTLGQPDSWLFPNDMLTRPVHQNTVGYAWRRACKKAEVAGFTLHDLRHFYASGLIAAGCDVVTVQRYLGHKTATVTLNTYSHLWPSSDDRARAATAALMSSVELPADYARTTGT